MNSASNCSFAGKHATHIHRVTSASASSLPHMMVSCFLGDTHTSQKSHNMVKLWVLCEVYSRRETVF